MNDYLTNGPDHADTTFILAHGAGAPMDTPFMEAYAKGIADAGLRVIRFEFPYMAQRREIGKKRGPDTATRLMEHYREVVDHITGSSSKSTTYIGGKSMGGRIASMIVDSVEVQGVICLGYPFHPPGKPDKLRTEHLQSIKTPVLIVQGTRDTFGNSNEVPTYPLSKAIAIHWLEDGDHSFKPRKASGRTETENWREGIAAVVDFMEKTNP